MIIRVKKIMISTRASKSLPTIFKQWGCWSQFTLSPLCRTSNIIHAILSYSDIFSPPPPPEFAASDPDPLVGADVGDIGPGSVPDPVQLQFGVGDVFNDGGHVNGLAGHTHDPLGIKVQVSTNFRENSQYLEKACAY